MAPETAEHDMNFATGIPSEHARRYAIHELKALRQTVTHVFNTTQLTSDGHALFALREAKNARCDPFRSEHKYRRVFEGSSETVQTKYSQGTEVSDGDDDKVVFQPRKPTRTGRASWQLRGRESSDSSSQPLSAPPSLAAQKSENFQKFYRAVVSPTHIRVTAGGRIVPNMRPTQPLFSLDRHKHSLEPQTQESFQPWVSGSTVPTTDHRLPSHATTSPYHSVPLLAPLLPHIHYPIAASTEIQASAQTSLIGPKDNLEPSEATEHIRQAIQISPPSQFDLSRPFMYNGQLVYPLPLGFQPPQIAPAMPFGIVGNVNALGGQHWPVPSASTMPSMSSIPSANAPLSSVKSTTCKDHAVKNDAVRSSPSSKDSQEGLASLPSHLTHAPHGPPMTNMLNLSDIIRQQITGLEQQVKLLENQLGHNECHGGQQAHVPESGRSNQQLHTSLHNQPPTSVVKDVKVDCTRVSTIKEKDQNGDAMIGDLQTGQTKSSQEHGQPSAHQARKACVRHAKPDSGSMPTFRAPKAGNHAIPIIASPSPDTSTAAPESSRARSRLTAAAAKAPPFKPRSNIQLSADKAVEEDSAAASHTDLNSLPVSCSSLDILASSSGQYWSPAANIASRNHAPTSMPLVHAHGHGQLQQSRYDGVSTSGGFGRNLAHGVDALPHGWHTTPVPSGFDHALSIDHSPYLMGFPPPGVSFAKAESRDLVYSRPLTDVEIRARLLYWGKAPHESSKGLPKFDGRDFYPPSPRKTMILQHYAPQQEGKSEGSEKTVNDTVTTISEDSSLTIPKPHNSKDDAQLSFSNMSAHEKATLRISGNKDQKAEGCAEETKSDVSLDSWDQPRVCTTFQPKSDIKRRLNSSSPNLMLSDRVTELSPVKKSPRTRGFANVIPTFLQGILRRSPQHAFATPASGMLSATTAKAHLSQARGSAATSLKSPMHGNNASAQWSNLSREHTHPRDVSRSNSFGSMRNENQPPFMPVPIDQGLPGATDMLRKVNELDHLRSTSLNSAWSSPSKAIGPTFDSSAW